MALEPLTPPQVPVPPTSGLLLAWASDLVRSLKNGLDRVVRRINDKLDRFGDVTIEQTDGGSPSALAPILRLFRSAPAVTNNLLAAIYFEGLNLSGVRQRWAQINATINNATNGDGQLDAVVRIAGVLVNSFRIEQAGLIPQAGAFWTDAGASEGPYNMAFRKVTPTAGNPIGAHVATALNTAASKINFSKLATFVDDPTAGSEDSHADLVIYSGGAQMTAVAFRANGLRYKNDTARVIIRAGSPEGVEAAPVGSICHRTDGGAGTSFYVKEGGGSGNTGWVGK